MHAEFYSKNKFEKLLHLVGFITRKMRHFVGGMGAAIVQHVVKYAVSNFVVEIHKIHSLGCSLS